MVGRGGEQTSLSEPAGMLVSIRRAVNDEVANLAQELGEQKDEDGPAFVCECGNPSCRATVRLTLIDYLACPPGSVLAHRPGKR